MSQETTASPSAAGPRSSCRPALGIHCHVRPGATFPYAPNRRYTPEDAPKETLAALHAHLGIERAVIVQASCHGADNGRCWMPSRGGRIAIAVSPSLTRATARPSFTICTAVASAGSLQLRPSPWRHAGHGPVPSDDGPDPGTWLACGAAPRRARHRAADRDDAQTAGAVRDRPYGPDRPALGVEQPAFQALLDLVRMPTCWVKVSGSERISKPPYDAALPFARALVETAPDRVLWGTDFPHPNLAIPADEADLVDLLPQFATTPEARQRLLVDNPPASTALRAIKHRGTRHEDDHDEISARAGQTVATRPPADIGDAFGRFAVGALLGSAEAQSTYPTKPVRVVVPFGPGGIADTSLRIVAEKLTGELGQQVIVENQPGAGGIIAANKVLKSEADGYTLAFLTNGTAISVPCSRSCCSIR